MEKFSDYPLAKELFTTLEKMKFETPTEIQKKCLPLLLQENPVNLVALASTGSGKTAAFALPILTQADPNLKKTQALVLCPTRELAQQVGLQFKTMGAARQFSPAVINGGAAYGDQIRAIKKGAHVIIATPGRLMDLIAQKMLDLSSVTTLVLDEADEMLSMGFSKDIDKLFKMLRARSTGELKTWLFSATMSKSVRGLVNDYVGDHEFIGLADKNVEKPNIEQIYFTVKRENKLEALNLLLSQYPDFHGLIFCMTKHEVDQIEGQLRARNFSVEAIHGDKSQRERERALFNFRQKKAQIIIATDLAARGIDVPNLTHVINYNLPRENEVYVHRVGRTGRAGAKGVAFNLVSPSELYKLADIQKLIGTKFTKGKLPSVADNAQTELRHMLTALLNIPNDSVLLKNANQMLAKEFEDKEEPMFTNVNDLLARMLVRMKPEVLKSTAEAENLDFMRHEVPREMREGGGGGRGGYSGGRGGGRFGGGGGRGRFSKGGPRREDSRGPRRDDGPPREGSAPRGEDRGPRREDARTEGGDRPEGGYRKKFGGGGGRGGRKSFGGGGARKDDRGERGPDRSW